jgi:hypothetical protein
MTMSAGLGGGERVSERLQESLARLREDIERVELWACALDGFSRPVPDYDPSRRYRLSDDRKSAGEKKVTKAEV